MDVPHIATCYKCRGRIHCIGGRWVHKPGLLAYSDEGGRHLASPYPIDEPEDDDA